MKKKSLFMGSKTWKRPKATKRKTTKWDQRGGGVKRWSLRQKAPKSKQQKKEKEVRN